MMNIKRNIISFFWIGAVGISIVTASFDLIGDNTINWAHYIFLGMLSITMVFSAVIWFFTYPCHSCRKLLMMNDNYCKRCGTALIKPIEQTGYEERVQFESIQESVRNELPTLQQFKAAQVKEGRKNRKNIQ